MTEVSATREKEGRLLEVVIDNPKGNIFTGAVMQRLDACLAEHADDDALALVTLRGAGKHFSFGASVEEHRREQVATMLATFHALIRRIVAYPVPVAALVSGRCLGGAFEVALACHWVIADETAIFACPEIKLGVFPPVLAALGPLRLGAATSERLLLTGEELTAREAERLGFLTRLTSTDVTSAAREHFDQHMAPLSSFALRAATRASRLGSGMLAAADTGIASAEALYLSTLIDSHDGNEGIEAFIAKRPPRWMHR